MLKVQEKILHHLQKETSDTSDHWYSHQRKTFGEDISSFLVLKIIFKEC